MKEIHYSPELMVILHATELLASTLRHEYITPEHLLQAALKGKALRKACRSLGVDHEAMSRELQSYLGSMEKMPEGEEYVLDVSWQFKELMDSAVQHLMSAGRDELDLPHVMVSMFDLEDSMAAYLLDRHIGERQGDFMASLVAACNGDDDEETPSESAETDADGFGSASKEESRDKWKDYVVCVNDTLEGRNPLIGREKELARTIQVLCRKDKNNPLHIGEPGVGKTALVYGLARMIEEDRVPERLRGSRIYSLEIGSLLAGTQFRGDFEKRLKMIMDGASHEENAIIYIDEIHNLVGAGATGEGSMDASNMLKPYLEGGKIRFIGSTTFDEYKRHFAKSKGLVRRFSRIDIEEPSVEEAIDILNQLKGNYERYHGVVYLPEAIEYAVTGSVRHITDRFLPDKAIDLIDEAGARCQAGGAGDNESREIDKAMISDTLSKVCKVDAVAMSNASVEALETLEDRIKNRLYGQDEAVRNVVEAVQMSKAGLADENKPLASLLFVGPTGVGKTELAKALAEELGIGLVRFDMSEYVEKHAVAKLIGSPAGYVGYDDGGLLTDAIRKTPDCVLLLDEIEKAHSDIYNILLQVMDYGMLTDNKGNRADFRNVVLIMTSNAGARYAAQANVGFGSSVSTGSAMLRQVKKTFQPEFINRLSATVVFNDMDRHMASLILDRKLGELEGKLKTKGVTLALSAEAREFLLTEGFSKEYGARKMDRVISSMLKPMLMRQILFGTLKEGGVAEVVLNDKNLSCNDFPAS